MRSDKHFDCSTRKQSAVSAINNVHLIKPLRLIIPMPFP
jgi:hypothetical protein